MQTEDILTALKALSDDKIWAVELALLGQQSRIDFWTLEPIKSLGFRASAYEIKVSRQDFQRDSHNKQLAALQYSNRFWYVTPPGLVTVKEIPSWAGLQEWDGKMLAVRKRAPKRICQPPDWEFVVSLMRNSAEGRRDMGIIKAERDFWQRHAKQLETEKRIKTNFTLDRWLAKTTSKSISN